MRCNSGKTDRTLRVISGLGILGVGWWQGSWWGLVGLVPLLTGAVGWCGLYAPFGISTCRQETRAS